MSNSKAYTLDTWKPKILMINTKQLDSDRTIVFNLKADGTAIDLTGKTVKYYITKYDNTTVFNDCNIINAASGEIGCPLTEQSLSVKGTAKLEIAIISATGLESTFTVYLVVAETIINSDVLQSSSEFAAFVAALAQVQDIDNRFASVNSDLADIPNQTYITDKAKLVDLNTANANISNLQTTKTDKTYVDIQVQNMSSQVQGFYATVSDLTIAFPSGNTNNYVITADNYIYRWNGSVWASTGVLFNANGIANGSVKYDSLAFKATDGRASVNLFNKNDIFAGSYIAYSTGVRTTNSGYTATNFIAILPSTQYTIIGASDQLAFYDSNKTYISGLLAGGGTWTSPSNAAYVRCSIPNASVSTFQIAQGVVSEYENYGGKLSLANSGYVQDDMIKPRSSIAKGNISPNLYNKDTTTSGYYIAYNTGSRMALAGYYASDYIPILPGTSYVLSGNTEQGAFYDIKKTYISGFTSFTNPTVSPANAYFVRLTAKSDSLFTTQFEQNTHPTAYKPFGAYLPFYKIYGLAEILNAKNVIILKADGSGDYPDLYTALTSITDASQTNRYLIILYEGTYDCIACLPSDMVNNPSDAVGNRGLEIPKFVTILGYGDRNKVILKGELADNVTNEQIQYLSTLNYSGTVTLKNLTVTAKNLRYPIHADSGAVQNCRYTIEDCVVIHNGNRAGAWPTAHAFGGGFGADSTIRMKNSKFVTYQASGSGSCAWLIHNSPSLTMPSYVELYNCEFINVNDTVAIHFGSMGSGQNEQAFIKICYYKGTIENVPQETGKPIDFTVQGIGNFNTVETY